MIFHEISHFNLAVQNEEKKILLGFPNQYKWKWRRLYFYKNSIFPVNDSHFMSKNGVYIEIQ